MNDITGFFAYPSQPSEIGENIERAMSLLKKKPGNCFFDTWKEMDIPGRFLADQVLESIDSKSCLIADISSLNFNVTYEIGYAIGKQKRLILVRYAPLRKDDQRLKELGIFDTIGFKEYQNSEELVNILLGISNVTPLKTNFELNRKAPLYLIEAKHKDDWVTRLISDVKKARLSYRSFDPNEQPRLSAYEAINNIAQSFGVLIHLRPSSYSESDVHNLRAAFLAGLAQGMDKVHLVLQSSDDPVPLDYRDWVRVCYRPEDIDREIAEFAPLIFELFQSSDSRSSTQGPSNIIEQVDLGASSAENELKNLGDYYLQTDAFQRTQRGEARIVVGRKGSGKTALFAQLRDYVRKNKKNIVIDLKPEGYKLLKFKESVLSLLTDGTVYHVITAFWEYLLLLEVCYKLLEKDKVPHMRDHRLYEPYRRLSELYESDEYVGEGDFSERMTKLISKITDNYNTICKDSHKNVLQQPEITNLLYCHDVAKLRSQVERYLKFKDSLWLLFDNLDKGWPTHGVQKEDLIIIRSLLEATRKIERDLQKNNIECHTIVFLRNDIYELLVDETPDRGKEAKVLLDWTDPDLLRELVRKRLLYSGIVNNDSSFNGVWPKVCVTHIQGEESSQHLIERSLMRPRCLLDLLQYSKSYAVNLGHDRITEDDISKGLSQYSTDLLVDIGYEIRDVFPEANDILYAFIGSKSRLTIEEVKTCLLEFDIRESNVDHIIGLLFWYGFLGIARQTDQIKYIYDFNYDIKLLRGLTKKIGMTNLIVEINPAFWSALGIVKVTD